MTPYKVVMSRNRKLSANGLGNISFYYVEPRRRARLQPGRKPGLQPRTRTGRSMGTARSRI